MKTAVQWLKEQYIERGETLPSGVFQEALEMEKEQLIEAYEAAIERPIENFAEGYYTMNYKDNA